MMQNNSRILPPSSPLNSLANHPNMFSSGHPHHHHPPPPPPHSSNIMNSPHHPYNSPYQQKSPYSSLQSMTSPSHYSKTPNPYGNVIPQSPNDTPPHSPYHHGIGPFMSPCGNSMMGMSPNHSPYYQKTPRSMPSPTQSNQNVSSSPPYAGDGGNSSYNLQDLMDDDDDPFKKKRKRTSPDQLKILERIFMSHQHPNLSLRNQLAIDLQMTPRSVQIWFQNRRAKARNMEFKPNLSGGPIPSDLVYNIATIDKISNGSPTHPSQSPHPNGPMKQPLPVYSHQHQTPPSLTPPHSSSLMQQSPHHSLSSNAPTNPSGAAHQFIPPSPVLYSKKIVSGSTFNTEKNGVSIASIWNRIMNSRNIEFLNYNPDDPDSIDVNTRDNRGLSLLFTASILGYEYQIRRFIEFGANPNIRDNQGNTPLIAASLLGSQPIVELLLSHHADPNQVNDDGVSPLYAACKSGHYNIAKILLEHHAEVSQKLISTGESPILIASLKGYDKIVQLLLENDATPSISDNCGYTPLHHACIMGYFNIVKTLLAKGANKNAVDKDGHTPVINATLLGNDLILEYLLKTGSSVDHQDNEGFSAVHYAVRESRLESVKILHKYKANLVLQTKTKQNILHLASQFASVMMVQLILDLHFPIQQIDDFDQLDHTPLYLAIKASKTNLVKYLLSKGSSPSQTLEILHQNNENEDKEIINLLEQSQSKLNQHHSNNNSNNTKEKDHKLSGLLNDNEKSENDDDDDYYTRTLYKNSIPNRIISNSFSYQQQNH